MSHNSELILTLLERAKRPVLAGILKKFWDVPIVEYADYIWEKPISLPPIETSLLEAFEIEFCRIGCSQEQAQHYCASLQKTRILQTATHLTVTEGPTFLALHHLALMGLPFGETYLVGSFSGIPYANSAWSGCLNYSNRFDLEALINPQATNFSGLKREEVDRFRDSPEKRISLIPGKMRDSLVFQSKIPQKLVNLQSYFTEPIRKITPIAEYGGDFTVWSSKFCAKQLNRIIPGKSLLYFDLNEVVRNYLLKVLQNSSHPFYRLLFDRRIRERAFEEFSLETSLFTIQVLRKNKIRQESLRLNGEMLVSQNFKLQLSQEKVINELKNGSLCPGQFFVFSTLVFINGLTCFGGFNQVEYLAGYKSSWIKIDLLDQEVLRNVNVSALTSGRCVDESQAVVYPLDLLLGLEWDFPKNITVGELIYPLLCRLGVTI